MRRAEFYSPDVLGGAFALVVDADKDSRLLVTGVLRYCGALVTSVETPEEALTVMGLLKPDVVIVDFSTPQAAAIAFIDRVRALGPEGGGMAPVIAIGEDDAVAAIARAHGFNTYLARPLDPWTVCRTVADLLAT